MKTLQDLRNEIQELEYKELNFAQKTGQTRSSNVLIGILELLDQQYGTDFEETESVLKAYKKIRNKELVEKDKQLSFFD